MKIRELVRLFTGSIFTLGLAATLATACKAQEFMPPPGSTANGGTPDSSPLPNQQLAPDTPPYGFATPPAGTTPPPTPVTPPPATALPEQPPVTAAPSPDLVEKSNGEGELGDTGFGERGGMGGFGGGMHPVGLVAIRCDLVSQRPRARAANQLSDGRARSLIHPPAVDRSLECLSLTGGVRNRLIDTDAVLPDTGQPIPSELWDVNLGLRYARQLDDGWITGGGVSLGSASDHPFAGIREMYVGMNAMLRIPQGEHNAWLFSLMYSPTSELNFPVPGVAFSWNPSPEFHANIGLPLQVTWRPTEDWQFQASYMLISTVHLKAQYRITKHLSAFAAYDWSNEAYVLLDRPEDNDRFFMYDQRVSLGLSASLLPPLDGLARRRLRLRPLHVRGHVVRHQRFRHRELGRRTVRLIEPDRAGSRATAR